MEPHTQNAARPMPPTPRSLCSQRQHGSLNEHSILCKHKCDVEHQSSAYGHIKKKQNTEKSYTFYVSQTYGVRIPISFVFLQKPSHSLTTVLGQRKQQQLPDKAVPPVTTLAAHTHPRTDPVLEVVQTSVWCTRQKGQVGKTEVRLGLTFISGRNGPHAEHLHWGEGNMGTDEHRNHDNSLPYSVSSTRELSCRALCTEAYRNYSQGPKKLDMHWT